MVLNACVVLSACTDNDGMNYNVKGTVIDGGWSYVDVCGSELGWSANTVIEYYCSSSGLDSDLYQCPYRCVDGKCISSSGCTSPTGSDGQFSCKIGGNIYICMDGDWEYWDACDSSYYNLGSECKSYSASNLVSSICEPADGGDELDECSNTFQKYCADTKHVVYCDTNHWSGYNVISAYDCSASNTVCVDGYCEQDDEIVDVEKCLNYGEESSNPDMANMNLGYKQGVVLTGETSRTYYDSCVDSSQVEKLRCIDSNKYASFYYCCPQGSTCSGGLCETAEGHITQFVFTDESVELGSCEGSPSPSPWNWWEKYKLWFSGFTSGIKLLLVLGVIAVLILFTPLKGFVIPVLGSPIALIVFAVLALIIYLLFKFT